ncbi:MAG: hypothetical protein RL701_5518, partial [Pseudomonadota bacterium]
MPFPKLRREQIMQEPADFAGWYWVAAGCTEPEPTLTTPAWIARLVAWWFTNHVQHASVPEQQSVEAELIPVLEAAMSRECDASIDGQRERKRLLDVALRVVGFPRLKEHRTEVRLYTQRSITRARQRSAIDDWLLACTNDKRLSENAENYYETSGDLHKSFKEWAVARDLARRARTPLRSRATAKLRRHLARFVTHIRLNKGPSDVSKQQLTKYL